MVTEMSGEFYYSSLEGLKFCRFYRRMISRVSCGDRVGVVGSVGDDICCNCCVRIGSVGVTSW
jgi:hypothetical protein